MQLLEMRNFWPCEYLYLAVLHNVNTRSVWLIILAIQSYNNGCIQCGWGNNVLKYGSFWHFWNHIVASWGYLERFAHFSKTKLNMVCNRLKKYFEEVTTFLSLLWQLWCHHLKKQKWTNAASKAFLYCRTWRHLTQWTIKCWNNTYILLFDI